MSRLSPRLGLTLPTIPMQPPVAAQALTIARHFCARGYQEVWLAEVNSADSYALAGALSQVVPGTRIGTGVVPLATRSVMVHALAAATLHELTGGRFALGLGISSENIVRDWAGQPFDKPVTRMREALTALRRALRGEKVSLSGETLTMRNFRLPTKPDGNVPLLVGALNQNMLRLAGAMADGVVLNMVPEQALARVLAEVRRGAEEAGRDPNSLEVVARLHVALANSEREGRDVVRRAFGPYVATEGYGRFFTWLGLGEDVQKVREALARRDRVGVAKAMSDALCDAIGVTGALEHVERRIRAYAELGVDVCVINPIRSAPDEQRATYERLSRVLEGVTVEGLGVARATRGLTRA